MRQEQLAIEPSETSPSSPGSSTDEKPEPVPLYPNKANGQIIQAEYPHYATWLPTAHLKLEIDKKSLSGGTYATRLIIESHLPNAIRTQTKIEHRHGHHKITLLKNNKWVQWRWLNQFGAAITAKGTYSIESG